MKVAFIMTPLLSTEFKIIDERLSHRFIKIAIGGGDTQH
jgi:hypothetical protein